MTQTPFDPRRGSSTRRTLWTRAPGTRTSAARPAEQRDPDRRGFLKGRSAHSARVRCCTDHLADMRRFMPRTHRELDRAGRAAAGPARLGRQGARTTRPSRPSPRSARPTSSSPAATSRAHVRDPRGTGGTPYLEWLSQLVDETRAHMID